MSWLRAIHTLFLGILIAAMLAACSGGGGSGSDELAASDYAVRGSVTGLAPGETATITLKAGAVTEAVNAAAVFSFDNRLTKGTAYTVTAVAPAGKTCTVTGGSGTVGTSDVAVSVSCSTIPVGTPDYAVGGTVTGLGAGETVALTLSAVPVMETIDARAGFSFSHRLIEGTAYTIGATAPAGKTCAVTGGSGTVGTSDVTVSVSCSTIPVGTPDYAVGGAVTGLGAGEAVALTLKAGSVTEIANANAGFSFTNRLTEGTAYTVTATAPAGKTCAVTGGSGTVGTSDVTVTVSCSAVTYAVSGTVTGLGAGETVALTLNAGSATETINAGAGFSFTNQLTEGTAYTVTATAPAGKTCAVTGGSGTVGTADVTVTVSCSAVTYAVGGTVSGLGASETVALTLSAGSATETINAGAGFSFTNRLTEGTAYAVTAAAPAGKTCAVSGGSNGDGSGKISGADVTLSVACSTVAVDYTVSGTVTGLASGESVALSLNSGTVENISASSSFSFSPLPDGSDYAVTITAAPGGKACTVSGGSNGDGSGTITGADVTLSVACGTDAVDYTVSGTVTGLASGESVTLSLTSGVLVEEATTSGGFSFSPLPDDSDYTVTVTSTPSGKTCTVSDSRGWITGADVTVSVACERQLRSGLVESDDGTLSLLSVDPDTGELFHENFSPFMDPSSGYETVDDVAMDPRGRFAYIAVSHTFDVSNRLEVLRIDAAGRLSQPSPVITYADGKAATAVAVDPAGAYLYVYVDGPSADEIDVYAIDQSSGALTEVGQLATLIDRSVTKLAFSHDGSLLLAAGAYIYYIEPSSHLPQESRSASFFRDVVFTSDDAYAVGVYNHSVLGPYLYVDRVAPFDETWVTTASKTLYQPVGVGIDPTERFVYVADSYYNQIAVYQFDSGTGTLSESPEIIPLDATPKRLVVEGGFVYVLTTSGTIVQFAIDPTTGTLTQAVVYPTRLESSFLLFANRQSPPKAKTHRFAVNVPALGQVELFAVEGPAVTSLSTLSIPNERVHINNRSGQAFAADFTTVQSYAIDRATDEWSLLDSQPNDASAVIEELSSDPGGHFLGVFGASEFGASESRFFEVREGVFGYTKDNTSAAIFGPDGQSLYYTDASYIVNIDYWSGSNVSYYRGLPLGTDWVVDMEPARSGAYLFALNRDNPRLRVLSFNQDRTLNAIPVVSANVPFSAEEVAVHPSGRFVYVRTVAPDSIQVFEIDAGTGTPTPTGQLYITRKTAPGMRFDPAGEYLYMANFDPDTGAGSMSVYALDPETGTPSELTTLPYGQEVFVGGAYCGYE